MNQRSLAGNDAEQAGEDAELARHPLTGSAADTVVMDTTLGGSGNVSDTLLSAMPSSHHESDDENTGNFQVIAVSFTSLASNFCFPGLTFCVVQHFLRSLDVDTVALAELLQNPVIQQALQNERVLQVTFGAQNS